MELSIHNLNLDTELKHKIWCNRSNTMKKINYIFTKSKWKIIRNRGKIAIPNTHIHDHKVKYKHGRNNLFLYLSLTSKKLCMKRKDMDVIGHERLQRYTWTQIKVNGQWFCFCSTFHSHYILLIKQIHVLVKEKMF